MTAVSVVGAVELVLIFAAVVGAVFFVVLFDLADRWKKKRRP